MCVKRIFLVGFMGSGKSTVGRNIARALNWKFIDLDNFIEDKEGSTITDIFNKDGENEFRVIEKKALDDVIEYENVVVATGGGAPCYFNNMQLMKDAGLTIYLKLSSLNLFERLVNARKSRPLIATKSDSELLDYIEAKLTERDPFYKQASVIADASATGVEPYLKIIKLANKN